jgi:hypothetical protein
MDLTPARLEEWPKYSKGTDLNLRIESPVPVDARLPEIPRFIVLPGTQLWMAQVLEQKLKLLVAVLWDAFGRAVEAASKALGVDPYHPLARLAVLLLPFPAWPRSDFIMSS